MSPIKYRGTFFERVFMTDGDNFWEANLLRGCSAWRINDQIIMPRAGEFSLRKASEDCLKIFFVGLVVRGKYVWCLVIFVIFMRFGGAELGDVLKSSFRGWQCKPPEGGAILMGKEGVGFSLCVILLC